MRSPWLKALAWLVGVFALIQFIPVKRTNPPVTSEIEAPAEIMEIIQRSCYDCHSNETDWPWYSRVAPMSWVVADDVNLGRKMLNFSEWADYPEAEREDLLEEIADEVEDRDMPKPMYLWLHPEARLTEEQMQTLTRWAEREAETAD
jgi:hypothetical protein